MVRLAVRRPEMHSRPGRRRPAAWTAAWTAVIVSGMARSPGLSGPGDAGSFQQTWEQGRCRPPDRASYGRARGQALLRSLLSSQHVASVGRRGLDGPSTPWASRRARLSGTPTPTPRAEPSAPVSVSHLGC